MIQPADGGMATFSFMSRRFLDLLGLDRAIVEKDPVRGFDCVHPDDYQAWITMNIECFEQRKPFYGETRVVVNGQVRWVLAESVPRTQDDGSTVWEGALSDITARKIAEQSLKDQEAALRKAKEAAEEKERQKSNLLAHISHEVRTPLASMLGLAELLGREPLNERQRQLLVLLQQSGNSLLNILNAVLDHSKLEANRLQIQTRPFSINTLLSKVGAQYQWAAAEKGLQFRVTNIEDTYSFVLGDGLRLEQVLSNLLSNAVKFTSSGEIHLCAALASAKSDNIRLRIDVVDTGSGIDSADLETLFTAFSQASSYRQVQSGSGLGLSISKSLIELMGGVIGVESRPGQGSIFWFELPFRLANQPPKESDTVQAAKPTFSLSGKTVLLVDDNPTVLLVVSELLTKSGARVITKSSGEGAIEFLQCSKPICDAAVIDLQMPGMGGIEAIRTIRSNPKLTELPIVVLTAGLLHDERAIALEAGANDVLFKPAQSNELAAALSYAMRGVSSRVPETSPTDHSNREAEEKAVYNFKPIEGIDLKTVMLTTSGNTKLFMRLLNLFCTENQGLSTTLLEEIHQRNYSSTLRRLHNLKGAARYLGALEIAKDAELLETMIEPYVVPGHPLPTSSPAYPVIAEIQQGISRLTHYLEG
jgi:PAS domain S-box-containing protein